MEWLLYAGLTLSAGFDIGTTLYVLPRCPACQERNFLVAPIVRQPVLFAVAGAAGVVGVTWLSEELRQRTRWWWIVPASLTVIHVTLGLDNLSLVGRGMTGVSTKD